MDIEIKQLETEQSNENSRNIDTLDTLGILNIINEEDHKVAEAVKPTLGILSQLINCAVEQLKKGGRLFYIGSGTSGRLGILDASECPPTYGVSREMIQGIIAGGNTAITDAIEGAEDDFEQGKLDLMKANLTNNDVVVGIAASGRTPYVLGALEYANSIGACTGSICCVSNGKISSISKYPIEAITGPEVITGSTRMKAGTAQKMILNMISTSIMIKMGKVYGNLMVDVRPTNTKLKERAKNILIQCLKCSYEDAEHLLKEANYNVKLALCMGITKLDKNQCSKLLEESEGHISKAVQLASRRKC